MMSVEAIENKARSEKPTLGQRIDRITSAFKSVWTWENAIGWSSYGYRGGVYSSTGVHTPSIDYAAEVGDLAQNSIIMACIQFLMRAFPEAPLTVKTETEGGDEAISPHALTQMLRRPNPYYSGLLLWQATVCSFNLDGNAYWRKLRNESTGRLQELWYEPHTTIRPARANADEFITHYELFRRGRWLNEPQFRIPREDIVHFRFGLNSSTGKGQSMLAAALQEVFTDQEAAAYTAIVLRNVGVPPLVISPTGDVTLTTEEAEQLKVTIMQKTQGNHRGEPIVTPGGVRVDRLAFDPTEMNLRELRQLPEERICALLGLQPSVIGLGAGLEHSALANVENNREQAYDGNLIPTQQLIAADITSQLLPEFTNDPRQYACFDYTNVRSLQEDEGKKAAVTATLFDSGIIKRSEARKRHNFVVTDEDAVYKLSPLVEAALLRQGSGNIVTGGEDIKPDAAFEVEEATIKPTTNGHSKEPVPMSVQTA